MVSFIQTFRLVGLILEKSASGDLLMASERKRAAQIEGNGHERNALIACNDDRLPFEIGATKLAGRERTTTSVWASILEFYNSSLEVWNWMKMLPHLLGRPDTKLGPAGVKFGRRQSKSLGSPKLNPQALLRRPLLCQHEHTIAPPSSTRPTPIDQPTMVI